ncbi:MAG: hypothetical protein NTZ05_13920 [Chloroflexi bacterium]|nr:hypothetical protein [Chloroflexota bacterium]
MAEPAGQRGAARRGEEDVAPSPPAPFPQFWGQGVKDEDGEDRGVPSCVVIFVLVSPCPQNWGKGWVGGRLPVRLLHLLLGCPILERRRWRTLALVSRGLRQAVWEIPAE